MVPPKLPPPFVRALAFGAIVVAGVAVSVGLYRSVINREELRRRDELSQEIANRQALIRATLRDYEDSLFALKLLFADSDEVTPREFENAARALIRRYPGFFALQWAPLVSGSRRAEWTKAAAAAHGGQFEILEHAPGHGLVPAARRDRYFPVFYSEPAIADWNSLGCDLGHGPLAAAFDRAAGSGSVEITGQLELVTTTGRRHGLAMVLAVFGPDETPRELRGFLLGVFRVDDLLVQSWNSAPASIADVMFVDDSASPGARRVLYYHQIHAEPAAPVPTEAAFRAATTHSLPLAIGSRRWTVLYRPDRAWLAASAGRPAGLILLSGLVITGLLAAFLGSISRHSQHVEREVAQRTLELTESRRRLDALLQSLPGMAYRCRYDTVATIEYVSEGALALTGYAPDDFTCGRIHLRDLVVAGDLPAVRERTLTALLVERAPFEVEYRIHDRGGREKWILSRGRGVYADDHRLLFFEGLAIDITARKQAESARFAIERKLLESQKLESLGLLAGGIAHDFNNLLAGILGHANLARLDSATGSELTLHLSRIEAASHRAADLCQQMLAYSGRGHFQVGAVDLSQLVRDTLPLLKGSIPPHARVELDLAPAPMFVTADATQIRQIVMNLLLNAVDAVGAAGGEIVLATGRRNVDPDFLAAAHASDTAAPGEHIFLTVRDTGCGMGADTVAKIFDPFFTTKFTGRGLGLAAVLGIVRGHSGALRVESQLGRGSTFTLVLPPCAEPPPAAPEPAPRPSWHRAGKVLVIDDEAPVREVAAALIGTFGLTVVTAIDGADGLARFRADPGGFDLVFLDLTMPGLDGEETLAALRALSPGVRVLLVSGYSENDRITRLAHDGPLMFMQKPFTRGKLEDKLREIFA
ncbi:MAG TPA: CHASE domain-containing protein [Opitutus sp.]|nr:CHASE domain-containing protein [Opitutus sp.]